MSRCGVSRPKANSRRELLFGIKWKRPLLGGAGAAMGEEACLELLFYSYNLNDSQRLKNRNFVPFS